MKTLKLIWKNKDLRNKLLIVIAILFGIRILSGIPTPGVNRNYFKLLLAQNSTLNFFNAISGNGLSNLSIMALSITPYITASIIIQLLGVIFPQVKELQQCKTKADKRKYEWILVFSGAGLACLESLIHGNRFWPERTSNKIQMVLRIIDYSYLDNYGNTYLNYWKNNICKISWKRYFINSCIQHTVQLSIRQCKYL